MCRVWPEKREAHAPRRRGHVRSGAARPHRAELDVLGRLVEDVVGVLEEHLVELGLRGASRRSRQRTPMDSVAATLLAG